MEIVILRAVIEPCPLKPDYTGNSIFSLYLDKGVRLASFWAASNVDVRSLIALLHLLFHLSEQILPAVRQSEGLHRDGHTYTHHP